MEHCSARNNGRRCRVLVACARGVADRCLRWPPCGALRVAGSQRCNAWPGHLRFFVLRNAQINNELRQLAWADLLHASSRLIGLMDSELTARGLLSMTWYDVLLQLKRAPDGRLRLSELSRRVVLSRSGLTRLLDRVESAGLLRRETVPQDRRGAYAVLLPAGDAALRETWEVYEGLILEHFGSKLSDAEAHTLHTVLSRLRGAEMIESAPMSIRIGDRPATRRPSETR